MLGTSVFRDPCVSNLLIRIACSWRSRIKLCGRQEACPETRPSATQALPDRVPPCRARGLWKVAVALGVTRVRDGLDVAQRGLARPDRRWVDTQYRPAVRLTGIPP